MKYILSGILIAAATALVHYEISERSKATMKYELLQSENRLLKDELNQIGRESLTKRTYEEGFNDGLLRANVAGYTEGYHAAMKQREDEVTKK